MNLLKSNNSQFYTPSPKPVNAHAHTSKVSDKHCSLQPPKHICSDFIENVGVEVNIAQDDNARKESYIEELYKENGADFDNMNSKVNVEEASHDDNNNENINLFDLSFFGQVINYRNVSFTKVIDINQKVHSDNGKNSDNAENSFIENLVVDNIEINNSYKNALDASSLQSFSSTGISVPKVKGNNNQNLKTKLNSITSENKYSLFAENNRNDNSIKYAFNNSLLKNLCNNKEISVTKAKSKEQKMNADIIIQNIGHSQAIHNNSIVVGKMKTDASLVNSTNTNENTAQPHNLKAFNDELANLENFKSGHNNIAHINIAKVNLNDEATNCLEDFEEVLAEVQNRNSKNNEIEDLSLKEIDNTYAQEVVDWDSTYTFQEFHYTGVNENQEFNDSIFDEELLNGIFLKLHDKIATEVLFEDGLDVISLSSHSSADKDVQQSTEVIQIKTMENDKNDDPYKTSQDLINIETISFSSDTPDTDIYHSMNQKNTSCNPKITYTKNSSKLTSIPENNFIEAVAVNKDPISEDDDDCGYHSSDFEFITEDEAKADGLLINCNSKSHILRYSNNSTKISNARLEKLNKNASSLINNNCPGIPKVKKEPFEPGFSLINHSKLKKSMDKNTEKIDQVDESYIENYNVPNENEFIDMFHAQDPGLPLSEIHFLENKSLRTRAPMLVQYDGIGFDMNLFRHRIDSADDQRTNRDEADETANKILEMYPEVNTRRKRRRRRYI